MSTMDDNEDDGRQQGRRTRTTNEDGGKWIDTQQSTLFWVEFLFLVKFAAAITLHESRGNCIKLSNTYRTL